ncbi:hypothetical protein MTO96_023360 [Rhipicephalus appendiculatus]
MVPIDYGPLPGDVARDELWELQKALLNLDLFSNMNSLELELQRHHVSGRMSPMRSLRPEAPSTAVKRPKSLGTVKTRWWSPGMVKRSLGRTKTSETREALISWKETVLMPRKERLPARSVKWQREPSITEMRAKARSKTLSGSTWPSTMQRSLMTTTMPLVLKRKTDEGASHNKAEKSDESETWRNPKKSEVERPQTPNDKSRKPVQGTGAIGDDASDHS